MSWFDGLRRNRAELRVDATDPDLRPFAVSLAPIHAVTWARGVIAGWPRWTVVAAYEDRGMIHATHTTRLWRFTDDVHLAFEPDSRGSLVSARSQSRVGKGDLGQNARNLKELSRRLHRADSDRQARMASGAAARG
ncbi:DUF1499 domain-containing protein [Tautonia plasticadhaerens]|uniref:DUF1499 domain-containing protein n=1 Tax=Tautonia plasticadhaerens TaxID=2527974 RepID=A0A518GXQ0_9BACT|nr:DUF1499 domain-containing protein [Tautonia plasticadhaerens]QDV33374.1 hypothetical protein ElP_12450 [Tautonia plasticadhaerens]